MCTHVDECVGRSLDSFPGLFQMMADERGGFATILSNDGWAEFAAELHSMWHAYNEPIPGRGISAREAGHKADAAIFAELEILTGDEHGAPGDGYLPQSRELRLFVIEMHLRGFENECIDATISPLFLSGTAARTLRRFPPPAKGRQVVVLHLSGSAVGEIVRVTGVPASTVIRTIRTIGEHPNRTERLAKRPGLTNVAVKMYKAGASEKQIAAKLGLTVHAVEGRLKRARRRGAITGYRPEAPQARGIGTWGDTNAPDPSLREEEEEEGMA